MRGHLHTQILRRRGHLRAPARKASRELIPVRIAEGRERFVAKERRQRPNRVFRQLEQRLEQRCNPAMSVFRAAALSHDVFAQLHGHGYGLTQRVRCVDKRRNRDGASAQLAQLCDDGRRERLSDEFGFAAREKLVLARFKRPLRQRNQRSGVLGGLRVRRSQRAHEGLNGIGRGQSHDVEEGISSCSVAGSRIFGDVDAKPMGARY